MTRFSAINLLDRPIRRGALHMTSLYV